MSDKAIADLVRSKMRVGYAVEAVNIVLCADELDAAIKAAQPVGYDTLPDSKFDAKFKHVGVSPHAQPEPMSDERIDEIMGDCGIHPEAFGEVWTGNVQLRQFARALLAAAQEAK
jgi:hypothetical protein